MQIIKITAVQSPRSSFASLDNLKKNIPENKLGPSMIP